MRFIEHDGLGILGRDNVVDGSLEILILVVLVGAGLLAMSLFMAMSAIGTPLDMGWCILAHVCLFDPKRDIPRSCPSLIFCNEQADTATTQPFVEPCGRGLIEAEPAHACKGREIAVTRQRMVLAACVLASSMAFIDGSALSGGACPGCARFSMPILQPCNGSSTAALARLRR